MAVKRTPKSWAHYLSDSENPVTLEEFTAACLSLLLGHVQSLREAAEHTEGMVGAIDQLAHGVASMTGLPYSASADVRHALDLKRSADRKALTEASDA